MSLRQHRRWRRAACCVLSLTFATHGLPQANPPPKLISSTAGQFTAHAPEAVSASVLCVLASQVKREWLRRLDIPDQWRDPIVLVLAERPAAASSAPGIWLNVVRTELHLKFEIHLRFPPVMEQTQVVSAMVGALCGEYANRAREFRREPPYAIAETPPWLVEGLAQSVAADTEWLLPVLRRYVSGGTPAGVQELLAARSVPVEPGERLRFQAYAWALVEGLLSLPKGPEKLCRLLREPESFDEIYRWMFPDAEDREKWWSLLLADRAATLLAEGQTAAETSQRLAAVLPSKLQMRLPDAIAEAPVAFADLGRYTEKDWLAPLVRDKLAQLAALRATAHPSYRDTIERYVRALEHLRSRHVSRFQRDAKLAERAHRAADELTRHVSDYLDGVEEKRAPLERDSVRQQLRLLGVLQEMNILRRDPISDYLDKFDR
ncbi:MAG: hypothetical protein FJ395_08510 [Verrucomicrobia bacterium]|nr:hypothetical protein [Verrucomicrobiota bacterium]